MRINSDENNKNLRIAKSTEESLSKQFKSYEPGQTYLVRVLEDVKSELSDIEEDELTTAERNILNIIKRAFELPKLK